MQRAGSEEFGDGREYAIRAQCPGERGDWGEKKIPNNTEIGNEGFLQGSADCVPSVTVSFRPQEMV